MDSVHAVIILSGWQQPGLAGCQGSKTIPMTWRIERIDQGRNTWTSMCVNRVSARE